MASEANRAPGWDFATTRSDVGSLHTSRALLGHVIRAHWRVALAWAIVFAITCASTITGYASAYPHTVDRLRLAQSLARSGGLQAVFGAARHIETIGGFTAWRTLAFLPLVAGLWGLLAAARALRGEEEEGRFELVLATPIDRRRALYVVVVGLILCAAIVWAGTALALTLVGAAGYGLPLAGSLYLALALVMPAVLFIAVGALVSELSSTRRLAVTLGSAIFGLAFIVRVAADSSPSLSALRWATPLGWIEELRPLTGARPLALLPIAALCVGSLVLAGVLASRRDLGAGTLHSSEEAQPRLMLLRSASTQAFRSERGHAIGWATGLALTGLFFGLIAKSVAQVVSSSGAARKATEHFGRIDVATAAGYLGLIFLFIVVAVCVYAANQAGATREEEASGRLDALLTQPVARERWLAARLFVSLMCLLTAILSAVLLCWIGAAAQSSGIPLSKMLEAGLNAVALGLLFLGLGTLVFGFVPRLTASLTLGLVAGTFLLEMVGSVVKAPSWLLDLSPFHHLSLAPAASLDVTATLAMVAVAAFAALLGMLAFARRDLAEM